MLISVIGGSGRQLKDEFNSGQVEQLIMLIIMFDFLMYDSEFVPVFCEYGIMA